MSSSTRCPQQGERSLTYAVSSTVWPVWHGFLCLGTADASPQAVRRTPVNARRKPTHPNGELPGQSRDRCSAAGWIQPRYVPLVGASGEGGVAGVLVAVEVMGAKEDGGFVGGLSGEVVNVDAGEDPLDAGRVDPLVIGLKSGHGAGGQADASRRSSRSDPVRMPGAHARRVRAGPRGPKGRCRGVVAGR